MMIDAPCLDKVDWAHWRSSAHAFPQSNGTLAREVSASSEKHKTDKGALATVRRDYDSFLTDLVAEIRQRSYSIRTEKVYELWVCRFIIIQ
ncbi:MAG: hypothetical protein GXP17_10155 [Gammaproteobacteria bacterium]|nr:hypothetical protein [Gammaproteobacteria bacterium]